MAVTTPSLALSLAGIKIDRQTASAGDFASLPNDVVVHQIDTGEVFKRDSSGAKIVLFDQGGFSNFVEALTTAAPNATVNVASFTVVVPTTDGDYVIEVKGVGAILAQIPDNTTTGGNKRGIRAVDWQMSRNSNSEVASGARATILNGDRNTASGIESIAGGRGCLASNNRSLALIRDCIASGARAFAIGFGSDATDTDAMSLGTNMLVSGANGVGIGRNGTATGVDDVNIGNGCVTAAGGFALGSDCFSQVEYGLATGKDSSTFSVKSRRVHGRESQSQLGDSQGSDVYFSTRTTDDTVTTLVTADTTPAANNQLTLQNNNTIVFTGKIVVREKGATGAYAAWKIEGVLDRGANAASTVITGVDVTPIVNVPTYTAPTLTANTTLGSLKIDVAGEVATDLHWTCVIDTVEAIYV